MDDERIWGSEDGLWTGDAENYRATIDEECLMVLPEPPFVMSGGQAADAVASTPRWSKVALTERRVSRPQEGLIVIAYKARAEREGMTPYEAHCTTTYRRLSHEVWRVIQHQQTPPLMSHMSSE
ncbi:DUF4440 domain-containing protein [Lichenicoccus sp.]|uniref:DUF4440 domain-containing protein n=1 Tax=Lichenicoccus sp. TaxID=2781899 RepID=UPI003D12FE98